MNRAYLLLRAMSMQDDSPDPMDPERVAELVAAQSEPEPIMRGLGAVINELIEFVDDAYRATATDDAEGPVRDALHVFQPAIIARLANTSGIDRSVVPVIAGAFTAASLGFDCYEWRSSVGPWRPSEYPVWAYATWFLCDLIGHVRGQAGFALNLIGSTVDKPIE